MATVRGTIRSIVYRNEVNGYTVMTVKPRHSGEITAVGELMYLSEGEEVELEGVIVNHPQYGEQLKVQSYTSIVPESEDDILKYLSSGIIKGIGKYTAELIVRKFGAECFEIMDKSPEKLTSIPGIGPKKAAVIAESYAATVGARHVTMFLQRIGLSANMASKIINRYGLSAERAISENPYRLCDEIESIGFRRADEIAFKLGFTADSPFRLAAGINYVLNEAASSYGHTYLPLGEAINAAMNVLNVSEEAVSGAIGSMLANRRLVLEKRGDEKALYLPKFLKAEEDTAASLICLMESFAPELDEEKIQQAIAEYEDEAGVTLADRQRQAVISSAMSGVSVITGGPGTGKTTSIRCLLSVLSGEGRQTLCAPTGRAAKRMSEATGVEAKTIHRLLEYSGDEDGFMRDASNPIDAETIIVDEMSMVDIFLMRALLRAARPGTRIILVGDADQLPSVGAGNVLKDIIASGAVKVTALDVIFRQARASEIIMNAHRINRGEYPVIRSRDTDFFMQRRSGPAAAAEAVLPLVSSRLPAYLGIDPLRDIQVMAPIKKGAAGVYRLNELLQEHLNPPKENARELKTRDMVFRVGDKVMQIKNDYNLKWMREDEYGTGVFNGDIGYIQAVDASEGEIEVLFDDGRLAVYTEEEINELTLAYCVSVHKSQGSEFDAVVIVLTGGPGRLMTRSLLYTAVTRAKKLVVIVGSENCVRAMVDNNVVARRYSGLENKLRLAASGSALNL